MIIKKFSLSFLFACGLLVSFFSMTIVPSQISAQERKPSLREQYELLKKQHQQLQADYWNDKEIALKEKQRLNEELESINDALKSDYDRKNNFTEELYLVKENLSALEEKQDTLKNESTTFFSQVQELIDKEKKKVKSLFPYYVSQALTTLSTIEDNFSERKNIQTTIMRMFQYKEALLKESEIATVSGKDIKFGDKKDSVTGYSLRIGFIHESLNAPEAQGLVIKDSGLQGVKHKWSNNIPNSIKSDIKKSIRQAVDNVNQNVRVQIPLDVAQAGSKLKSFADSDTTNFFRQAIDFFNSGGIIMYPLSLLALLALAIVIERVLYYIRINKSNKLIIDKLERSINSNNISEAQRLCEVNKQGSPIARIMLSLLSNRKINFESAENKLEENLINEVPKLEKRLTTLAVLAAIAPLLGLLGTVSGMIELFDVITIYGTSNPKILAGGISIALVTTQAGLAIAIPTLLIHHVLIRTKVSIVNKIESLAIKALNLFHS